MLRLSPAGHKVQPVVAKHGGGTVFQIAQLNAKRIGQRCVRDQFAARYVIELHMRIQRNAVLLKSEHGERFTVRRQAGRYDIVFRGLVFENLFPVGAVNRDRRAVALLVRNQNKAAVPPDASCENGGREGQLRGRRGGIGQDRLHAAAVVDQHIVICGLHHRRSISKRIGHRDRASRARKEQRVAVRIGQTGFKQGAVGKRTVLIVDRGDIALMLAQARNCIFRKAADGGWGKQPVVGQQEQEYADDQQPAARDAQRADQAHPPVLAFPQQPAALLL